MKVTKKDIFDIVVRGAKKVDYYIDESATVEGSNTYKFISTKDEKMPIFVKIKKGLSVINIKFITKVLIEDITDLVEVSNYIVIPNFEDSKSDLVLDELEEIARMFQYFNKISNKNKYSIRECK